MCAYQPRIFSLLRSFRNPAVIRIPAPCFARRFMLMTVAPSDVHGSVHVNMSVPMAAVRKLIRTRLHQV